MIRTDPSKDVAMRENRTCDQGVAQLWCGMPPLSYEVTPCLMCDVLYLFILLTSTWADRLGQVGSPPPLQLQRTYLFLRGPTPVGSTDSPSWNTMTRYINTCIFSYLHLLLLQSAGIFHPCCPPLTAQNLTPSYVNYLTFALFQPSPMYIIPSMLLPQIFCILIQSRKRINGIDY